MISGWKSREEHDRDVNKPRVKEAYAAMQDTVKKTDTWGMQVTVIESNGKYDLVRDKNRHRERAKW